MHSKVSVFKTGKMISVGTKSEEQARRDLTEAADYLAQEGIVSKTNPGVKVRNVVLTGSFGKPIDLESFHISIGSSIYEPEQFPGIMHHPPKYPGVSILLFQSGKFVVAGVRSFKDIGEVESYLNGIRSRAAPSPEEHGQSTLP